MSDGLIAVCLYGPSCFTLIIEQSPHFFFLHQSVDMNPFGNLGIDLSQSELRETAYEILVAACRCSGGGRPLTYVSSSGRSGPLQRASSTAATASISAASKVKKALGLKSKKKKDSGGPENLNRAVSVTRRNGSTGSELMRVQMRITEQTNSRIRRGLLRVAAGQLGRRIESIVLPLELLQQLKASDFTSQQEYEEWQRRSLKVLEAGLIVHPHLPLDKSQTAPQRLRQILHAAREKPIVSGKQSESMQVLRNVVASLSCREFDGSLSDVCHWADGIPLNFHLYQKLLDACFDVNDEASIVEEVDEVLELVKKTWVVLGVNQMLHNLCFLWLLFHRYVTTGQIEGDLLFAADRMMLEVGKDAEATHDSSFSNIASSIMTLILEWTEQMLLHYHINFYRGNIDVMQSILSLGVSAAKLMEVDLSDEYQNRKEDVGCRRTEAYIRSSVRNAFSQEKEKVISSRQSSKYQQSPLPILSILSQNICDLAFNEKEIYSPVLKRWHPLATGVAVATLHTCFAGELKKFVSGISELNPEAIQVLLAADKLEKDLVEMAVSDSVDSEDGGKAIIQEMAPYEAEAVIANLVKSWIHTRVDRLGEWVDRNLQQENWNPQLNKGRFAPSAVEVLRTIDETLEAFFFLPIPMHQVLLPELMSGLDRCLQSYVIKGKSGCGSQATFVPTLPMLTRCNMGLKFFKKKDRSLTALVRKSEVLVKNCDDSFGIPQLCLRLNTLYNTRRELEVIEKRTMSNLRNGGYVNDENVANGLFGLSISSCIEGIQQLSEAAAYKVVFCDLSHLLWDYLYIGEVSSSRIEPFLQELEKNLEIISVMVHDQVRTRVITDVMRASFEGFLLVLLGGGPSRLFTVQDSLIIEEDFKFLADLFWSNGDGLPNELIDKLSSTFKGVLPLFQTSTEDLIDQFRRITINSYGDSGRTRLPLPPTTGRWSPTEQNTILRVLCNRNDKMASKFLKKMYGLPKKT